MKYPDDDLLSYNVKLIKELSEHFEEEHELPPLASRIYSNLILSEVESLTFEEIINITSASKSSVSNQINFLIEEGRVDFYFKNDKRKRYFKTNQDYLKKTLELHLEKIQREITMLRKIICYKKDQDFNKTRVGIFKNHLESEEKNIKATIEQLQTNEQ
jgi:DNA-binding transcriptional regulator GbsR (MarR family)